MTSDETTPQAPPQSFLIADCGASNTTVALFDEAAGSYRLIAQAAAPTTAAAPWEDIHLGLRQAIQQIADATGRTLLNKRGDLIRPARASGRGVDAFAAVFSAAPPLNTILAGLFDKVSLASARRALSAAYTHEIDTLTPADTRNENEQIASIVNSQPDIIFIAGGTDNGAERQLLDLVETVQIGALALSTTKPPHVIFAGNKALREQIRSLLGENIHLHVADNVRPSLQTEQLHDAANLVSEQYQNLKIKSLPGIQNIIDWSSAPMQPTAQALAQITDCFAQIQNGRVMAVDLGSRSVTLTEAAPNSESRLCVRTDLGMGQPIANILEQAALADIMRWLPSSITEAEAHNFIRNKALFPQTIPGTKSEHRIAYAAAREILRNVVEQAGQRWYGNHPQTQPLRLLLVRGSTLTKSPRPNQTLLMLLDTLRPTGIFSVALDVYGVLPALGVLAEHEPLAAVQALEGQALHNLGWVVVPTGKGQPGQLAMKVTLESGQAQRLEVEVEYGTIEIVPLAPGQSAQVALQPARRFDIGYGAGRGKTVTIRGGALGMVIDARGYPLDLPADDAARETLMNQWLWDIGG